MKSKVIAHSARGYKFNLSGHIIQSNRAYNSIVIDCVICPVRLNTLLYALIDFV